MGFSVSSVCVYAYQISFEVVPVSFLRTVVRVILFMDAQIIADIGPTEEGQTEYLGRPNTDHGGDGDGGSEKKTVEEDKEKMKEQKEDSRKIVRKFFRGDRDGGSEKKTMEEDKEKMKEQKEDSGMEGAPSTSNEG